MGGLYKKSLFLSIILLFSGGISFSQNARTDTVRVGYYENEVFQEGASKDAIKKGYAYEYYCKLSEYTGWEYEYVYGSYTELYNMLLEGKIDFLAGLAYKKDREGLIAYPEQAMGSEILSLIKHDYDSQINSNYQSLNGHTIGVLNSAMVDTLQLFLKQHNIKANIKKYNDYDVLFEEFDNNKIDVLAAEGDGAYRRKHSEMFCMFGKSDYYLCVNINRPDLLEKLNTAQKQILEKEPFFLGNLDSKYYSMSVSSRSFSESEKNWLLYNNELRIAYLNNFLPYSDTDKLGKVLGIVSDLIPEIEHMLGVKYIKNVFTGYDNYDEMIRAINEGEVDVIFPVNGEIYYSEENSLYQTNPVGSSLTELVYLQNTVLSRNKTFAVSRNNKLHYYYTKNHFPENKIVFYDSLEDCLDAVLHREVDFTTINGMRTEILHNNKYKPLLSMQLHGIDEMTFGVKIGNEGLLRLINRGLNIAGRDYIQNSFYKYTKKLYKYTWKDFVKDNLFLVSLIIVLVLVILFVSVLREVKLSKVALAASENANRAKTFFLNNMSHDIRTPINAIVGFTELAKKKIDNKQAVTDYLDNILVSSKHLISLVNDVLDMSRIDSGVFNLDKTEVKLSDLIEDLRIIIQTSLDEKEQNFSIDMSKIIHPVIITDKVRLNQILLNILSNAVKYTGKGGTISFSVEERKYKKPSEDETKRSRSAKKSKGVKTVPESEKTVEAQPVSLYEFKIKDNGIGISDSFQKIIFDSFAREEKASVKNIQGTGLGMSISKKIVEQLGGTISVSSKEGEGSEFTVQIPCEYKPEQIFTAKKKVENGTLDFTGRRLLLVEDNEMNMMIAQENLTAAGFIVETATDGVEAVGKVLVNPENYYDVILMDIQMPKMDGYQATKKIRSLDKNYVSHVPIIAVTANAFEEDRNRALQIGMNAYLSKPYDIPVMLRTISELLK